MRVRRLLPVLAALCFAATACGGSTSTSSTQPIILGEVLSFTGGMSAYDGPPAQGVDLAVADINAKGGVLGRQLKVIKFDQKTDAKLASTGAEQLISQGATAIITACDFDFGGPAALVANSHNMPGISTCAGDPKFGVQGIGPYAYSMALTSNYLGGAISEFAYNVKNWHSMYVITDTTIEFTKSVGKYTTQAFQTLGGKVVGQDTMSSSDQSIAAQITRLKAANPKPDFLLLSSFNPDLASAMKQIRDAGITLPVMGHAGYDGTYWLTSMPTLSDVYFAAEGFVFGPAIPAEWDVAQRITATFGAAPASDYVLDGYALIQALAGAMTQAGSTDGKAVNDKLQALTNFPTVMGPLTYTSTNHSPVRPVSINAFQNGKEVFIQQYTPKAFPNPFA
jgi:branched-chain amino acid transport system substrate-binding protein